VLGKENVVLAWSFSGLGKLRGIREIDTGRYPLYLGQEDIKHILLG